MKVLHMQSYHFFLFFQSYFSFPMQKSCELSDTLSRNNLIFPTKIDFMGGQMDFALLQEVQMSVKMVKVCATDISPYIVYSYVAHILNDKCIVLLLSWDRFLGLLLPLISSLEIGQ